MTVITAISLIDELDLEPIVFKLTHPEPGHEPIGLHEADHNVALYRCFLALHIKYPSISLVPTEAIDRIWHAHLSDTALYRADCEKIFGYPLDHFPYSGMIDPADQQAWQDDFVQTCRLFEHEFGIDLSVEGPNPCNGGSHCRSGILGISSENARRTQRPRPDRSRPVRPRPSSADTSATRISGSVIHGCVPQPAEGGRS